RHLDRHRHLVVGLAAPGGAAVGREVGDVDTVLGEHAADAGDDARAVLPRRGDAHGDVTRRGYGAARLALERAQQDREAVVALEALGALCEAVAAAARRRGGEQDHGEVGPEDRHARVLEVRVALEDEARQLGDEPGPVLADGGEDEPALHASDASTRTAAVGARRPGTGIPDLPRSVARRGAAEEERVDLLPTGQLHGPPVTAQRLGKLDDVRPAPRLPALPGRIGTGEVVATAELIAI